MRVLVGGRGAVWRKGREGPRPEEEDGGLGRGRVELGGSESPSGGREGRRSHPRQREVWRLVRSFTCIYVAVLDMLCPYTKIVYVGSDPPYKSETYKLTNPK